MREKKPRHGPQQPRERIKDPRLLCVTLLKEWEERRSRRIDELVSEMGDASALEQRDRGFLKELLFGIFRRRRYLDYLLEHFLGKGLCSLPPNVQNILRLGAYQVIFDDRVPAYASINESVELAKSLGFRGLAGVVNAVLRRLEKEYPSVPLPDAQQERVKHLGVSYSFPDWIVERFIELAGDPGAVEMMGRFNRIPPVYLRVNRLRVTMEDFFLRLDNEGIRARRDETLPWCVRLEPHQSIPAMKVLQDGLCSIQDRSSQLIAPLLDPQPGEILLDACSAPGGKTTHLAELMGDRGTIVALDQSRRRLQVVSSNVSRLGLTSVVPREANAMGNLQFLPGQVHRILADVPCSGLGVLGRRADLPWRLKESDIPRLAEKQLAILENLIPWLRPGGTLVYSTCTLTPEENRGLVKVFLARNKAFSLDNGAVEWPAPYAGLVDKEGFLETLPHRDDMDGVFAARLIRMR